MRQNPNLNWTDVVLQSCSYFVLIYHRNFKLKQCFHEKCYNAFGNTVKVIWVQNNTGLLLLLLYGQKKKTLILSSTEERINTEQLSTWQTCRMQPLLPNIYFVKYCSMRLCYSSSLLLQSPVNYDQPWADK